MNDNIFAGVAREDEDIENVLDQIVDKQPQEETTPEESQTQKAEIEAVDLKKNEAWKEMRQTLETERQAREDLEQRLKDIESQKTVNQSIEQPKFLTDLVGENAEVARSYYEHAQALKEEIKREFYQEQQQLVENQLKEKERWDKWTKDRLSEIESEYKVDLTTPNEKGENNLKNELAKVMLEYSPSDDQGNLDFRKGMKILTDLKKTETREENQKVQVKKNISDATVSKESSSKETKDYMTAADFRKTGRWR